jgi:hypothetical protein
MNPLIIKPPNGVDHDGVVVCQNQRDTAIGSAKDDVATFKQVHIKIDEYIQERAAFGAFFWRERYNALPLLLQMYKLSKWIVLGTARRPVSKANEFLNNFTVVDSSDSDRFSKEIYVCRGPFDGLTF